MSAATDRKVQCLTVDVEEHFQVSAFDSSARRHHWDDHESRVERNTDRLLELFDGAGARATFFVLGWIAERHPAMVERIVQGGHEIASHGYAHELVTALTPEQFRDDVRSSRSILEDICGRAVIGYRAPSFTIVKDTARAHRILVEEGYRYDSSVVPVHHDVYGMPGADPDPHVISTEAGPIWELPPTTVDVLGMRIPAGGGGYFRLFPYPVFERMTRSVVSSGRQLMFYLHPWEIDPEQPRMRGSRRSEFRHYVNLDKVEGRLQRLLAAYRFDTVRAAVPQIGELVE
jgi:polysaccharide deacetylase family protein (PEP-CTERM system associated)